MNIEERKPVWQALSELYLDNELQDYHFKFIANKITESPYTLEKIKQIDRNEVFPVLYTNLLSVAGVWDGFQEDWLVTNITRHLKNHNFLQKISTQFAYWRMKGMFKAYWENIEKAYIKSKDDDHKS